MIQQALAVSSRPIPGYFKGKGEGDNYSCPAWVGERGYELIESKQGGKSQYRLAAQKQLTYLSAHDRVYTHQETKRILSVNRELINEVRTAPGGSMFVVQSAGPSISEEVIERAMRNALKDLQINEFHWDEKGYREATRKADQHATWLNDYFNLKKRK